MDLEAIDALEESLANSNKSEPQQHYRKPLYSGLARVFNWEDENMPHFPAHYEVLQRKILHVKETPKSLLIQLVHRPGYKRK